MAIIWDTRDDAGGFGGDYTNNSWNSFMNRYAVRFTPELSGPGSAYENVTFSRSYSVFFPYTGDYVISASCDNSGSLSIGGIGFSVSSFQSTATTTRFYNRGTYTLSLSVVNAPGSNVYSSNPYGIAITVDAPPPPPPPTVTFTISPGSIIRGETATLSWTVTGQLISLSINQGIGNVATTGTRSVSPQNTTTYTITAVGEGGTVSRSVTLTVYIPPETLLTLDNATIIRGQCTFLRWTTTGDAGSATITPGIGPVNINGNRQICPTETTTYTINVSGLGGTDSDSITLTVYQPPTADLSGPASLNYGQQGVLTYQATDADISLEIFPLYSYKNTNVSGNRIVLSTGQFSSGTINTQIPYNDFGPVSVTYLISAIGNGGQENKSIIIPINIDETPANFLVPESEDLLKNQNPIYTPDSTVTSYEILIEDIDIPVEVKADRPILVDVNDQEIWTQIRSI